MRTTMSKQLVENTKEYLDWMKRGIDLNCLEQKSPELYDYWCELEAEINWSIEKIDYTNFWQLIRRILVIDSKMSIVKHLFSEKTYGDIFGEMSYQEIIQYSETDAGLFNHENCGYNLNEDSHESLIFLSSLYNANKAYSV